MSILLNLVKDRVRVAYLDEPRAARMAVWLAQDAKKEFTYMHLRVGRGDRSSGQQFLRITRQQMKDTQEGDNTSSICPRQ